MTDFIPTRRSLLGMAGAFALSKIALPWKPKPTDLLLGDGTPANQAEPVAALDVPPPPVSESHAPAPFDFHNLVGSILVDDHGNRFAFVQSARMRRDFYEATMFPTGSWRKYEPAVAWTLDVSCLVINSPGRIRASDNEVRVLARR